MKRQRPVRMLIAKAGLDGHERGALTVAVGLRDEGFEVIYTGLRTTPEQIVKTAIEEDVDVIGISSLAGAHNIFISKLVEEARKEGLNMDDVLLIVGGIVPDDDIPFLKEKGVSSFFGPGTQIKNIATYIRSNLKPHDD